MAENITEEAEDLAEEGKEKLTGGNGNDSLAKKILLPAAAGVGTIAASYAAKKAPDFFRDQLLPKLEDRGSDEAAKVGKQAVEKVKDDSGIAGKAAGAVLGKAGGGKGNGKKTRRLPIQRYTDVAVPVEKAYQAWTDFEKFPQFMHRVLSVQKKGNTELKWREKIWFSTREWEGKITDRRKNDRIAWKTTSGTQHSGIVSFHRLDDNLTRVMVTVDFHPTGILEKMGSGLRFAKRAVQADLARFKTYVEMQDVKQLEYGNDKGDDGNGDASRGSANGSTKSSSEREQERKQRAENRKQRKA
jgi:uncharacterized membrane protein